VGIISLQDKKFRKLVPEEVEKYVQEILAKHRETEHKE
jgi:proteasome alpha subunit